MYLPSLAAFFSAQHRLVPLACAALSLGLWACGGDDSIVSKPDTASVADVGADVGADVVDREVAVEDTSWTGKCVAGPEFCDDGNPCTIDGCDPIAGCSTTPKLCVDDDDCTIDACDVTDGSCKNTPDNCDDSNACTTGACSKGQGCIFKALDCSDGDKCTADGCSPLKGCLNTPLDCEDDITCTVDACVADTGCVHTKPAGAQCCEVPADCEDDNACTVHACTSGVCKTTAVSGCCKKNSDCADNNSCTLDTCAVATGQCSNTYQAAAGCCQNHSDCNDKVACTSDVCTRGACAYEVQCCETSKDCVVAGAVGLCGAATCTAGGCGITATPVTSCCEADVAATGFETSTAWDSTITAAKYGTWKLQHIGLSSALKTSKSGVGAASYQGQSTPIPGGQSIARLRLKTVTLAPGVPAKLTFWVRAQLVGGTLGDRLRLRVETATGAWLVWSHSPAKSGFYQVTVDLSGFAARPGTRTLALVFELEPNKVKSGFPKVWLDDVALTTDCAAPPPCSKDADCDDGLNATTEQCSEGVCVVTAAAQYCEKVGACNDKNYCTKDACTDFGCTHVPLPDCCTKSADCLDENPCTTDYCSGLKCKHKSKPTSQCCVEKSDCDDGNPCTLDQCPAVGLGCQHTQTNASCCIADAGCDDKDACTLDRCDNNSCSHQNQCCKIDGDCDDNDALCTVDTCSKAGLCSWKPTNAAGCCEPIMLKAEFDDGSTGGLILANISTLSKWQVVTGKRSSSGKGALYYGNIAKGNYDDQKTSGTATSKSIKVPAGEQTTLTFALWMETESGAGFDKFEVWIDTPKKKVRVWTKSSKGFAMKKWQKWSVDLSAWGGFDVKIRMLFDTNDAVGNKTEGVYLDDVRLVRGCKTFGCISVKDCDDKLVQTKDACTANKCVYTW